MTPLAILLLRAPCYSESARVNGHLAMAEIETSQTAYGDLRNKAVALLALHWLTLSERGKGGAAGAITSETEGDLSRTYAQPTTTVATDLASTIWGLELEAMGKKTGLSFINRQYGKF